MQRYTGAKGGGHTTHANTIREVKNLIHFVLIKCFCEIILMNVKSFFLLTKLYFSRFTLFQCQKNDKNNFQYNK